MPILPPISSKPACTRDDALAVVQRLRQAGHVAYFAGGCVRDLLLGLNPKDYDVATDAPPNRVRQLFTVTQAVGQAFGVILVKHRQSVVEVATFRTDGKYEDGRRPAEVHFTTAEEDAQRRDFTINGLFLDPLSQQVIDYVGGQTDLQNRLLRAIGEPEKRFAEDFLRLLRAVRFLARFGFALDPATGRAIRHHAGQLKIISPERIAEELRIMLTAPTRQSAWDWLHDLQLADELFRTWPTGPVDRARPWWPLIGLIVPGETISFGLALATGFVARSADVRESFTLKTVREAVRTTRRILKTSNDESEEMSHTLLGCGILLSDTPLTLAMKKRFLARSTARSSRLLLQALADVSFERSRLNTILSELGELEKTDYAPPPLVTGDDLTAAGLAPGPVYKKVLDQIYDEQLEGRLTDKSKALQEAIRLYHRGAQSRKIIE